MTTDEMRAEFEERHLGYVFPNNDLRNGALNEFAAGWQVATLAERERAAKVCEAEAEVWGSDEAYSAAAGCARKIRKGETP